MIELFFLDVKSSLSGFNYWNSVDLGPSSRVARWWLRRHENRCQRHGWPFGGSTRRGGFRSFRTIFWWAGKLGVDGVVLEKLHSSMAWFHPDSKMVLFSLVWHLFFSVAGGFHSYLASGKPICLSFSRENGHLLLICSWLRTSQICLFPLPFHTRSMGPVTNGSLFWATFGEVYHLKTSGYALRKTHWVKP